MASSSKSFVVLVWIVYSHAFSAVSARLQRRETPLVPLTIPLSLDPNGRYTAGVNMSSGPSPQRFQFALSAGIGYTTVAGIGCSSCTGVPAYDATASTSAKALDGLQNQNITLLDGSSEGHPIKEDCTLHVADGPAWSYPNQTIIVADESSSIYSDGVSGIFGLGINGKSGDFNSTVISGWLNRNPTHSNFSYGMNLGDPRDPTGNGGTLHWVSPIPSSYEGDVQWLNASTSSSGVDWNVPMTGWSSTSGSFAPSRSDAGLRATIDPYYPNIYMPLQDSRLLFAGVSGANPRPTSSFSTSWSVPCSTTMTFTVSLGEASFTLDQSTLIIHESETQCVSAIEGWTSAATTDFLLGATFISSLYLIFQVSRGANGSIGFARRTGAISSPLSKGAIAGISVGVVVAVLGISFGIWLFYHLRQKKNKEANGVPPQVEKKPTDVEPFDLAARRQNTIPPNVKTEPPPTHVRRVLIEESPGVYVEASNDHNTHRSSSQPSSSSYYHDTPTGPYHSAGYAPDTPNTFTEKGRHSRAPSSTTTPASPTPLLYENPPPLYEV